jgi:hypothetical protein
MPAHTNASSYIPVDYSVGTRGFWGTFVAPNYANFSPVAKIRCCCVSLFDDHWIPSPVFCRLVDSLFFYANENSNIPSLKNNGKMEFSKILYVRSAVAGEAAITKLPVSNH